MTRYDDLDPATRERLAGLASTGDEPAWTPDAEAILSQGRRAVRRRRFATAVAGVCGVAAVATAAVAAPGVLGGIDGAGPQAEVAAAPTAPAETRTPDAAVPAGPGSADWQEVLATFDDHAALDRCREQLQDELPDVSPDEWDFADGYAPEEDAYTIYRLGDRIEVVAGDQVEVCFLLGNWRADPPVDFDEPAPPADDHAAILHACSAVIGVDLRSWEVRAAMADGVGGLDAVIASPEADPHVARCRIQPSSWDTGLGSDVRAFGAPLSELKAAAAENPIEGRVIVDGAHTCIKSVTPCSGGMYSGAGVLSDEVASLKFELRGDQVVTVPVEDGIFVFRGVDGVTEGGWQEIWASAYDADGELLERFVL